MESTPARGSISIDRANLHNRRQIHTHRFMRTFFSILTLGLLISPCSYAQIEVYKASVSNERVNKAMPYDSTKNFLGYSHAISYVGQILYVNGVSSPLQKYGYDYIYSRKTRGSGCYYGVPYGAFATRAPYDSLAGKYFIVKSVSDASPILGEYWFQLENRDDSNDTAWYYYQGKYEHAFPFIVLSYFEYVKQRYADKKIVCFYYTEDDEFKIELRKCVKVGIEDKYYNLSLFFEDGKTANVNDDREKRVTVGGFMLMDLSI